MGILSWWQGNKKAPSSSGSKPDSDSSKPEVHGAVEVPRSAPLADITIFEFGSVANSSDKVTLAGFCPVSDDFEPCRWEILPAADSKAPQFRIVF